MSRAPAAIVNGPMMRQHGAQPYGTIPDPLAISITTLTGASNLPARPATAPAGPAFFLATLSGALTGNATVTLPVSGYIPGDYVRVQVSTVAAFTLAVKDGGSGTPTLATLPATLTTGGQIDAQLNAAGTHWTLMSVGGA